MHVKLTPNHGMQVDVKLGLQRNAKVINGAGAEAPVAVCSAMVSAKK